MILLTDNDNNLYYMDNICVWCAALSLHPFCLDYISLGLGNITKNTVSFFFSFTYFNIFDTVAEHILKNKKRSDSPKKETVA